MCSAADRHILDETYGFFFGINHFEMFYITFSQFPAHDLSQRADRCLINVCHLKSCRIQFISGSHAADNRYIGLLCLQNQLNFGCDCVHSIYHIRILTEIKFIPVFRKEKTFMCMDHRMGINLQNPFFHNVCFILANRFSGSNDLAVQICQTHFVIVNQINCTHSAPCQSLCRISSHTSDTKNCHSGLFQPFHGIFT